MTRSRASVAVFLISLAASSNVARAQAESECQGILRAGIYDYFRENTSTQSAAQVRSEISRILQQSRATSTSGGASVQYGLFGGSVTLSHDDVQRLYDAVTNNFDSQQQQQAMATNNRTLINGAVINSWRECVTNATAGLRVMADMPDDPVAPVAFRVRYLPGPGVDPDIDVRSVQVTPVNALSCSWAAGGRRREIDDSFGVSNGNEIVLACVRNWNTSPVSQGNSRYHAFPARVTISTNRGSSTRLLGGVLAPPPVAASSSTPIGTVIAFSGLRNRIPSGWRVCDGAELPIRQFPELYAALGLTSGGAENRGVFNIPDLRGRFLRGMNENSTGEARDADATRALGSVQGWATGMPRTPLATTEAGAHSHGDVGRTTSSGHDTVHEDTDYSPGELNIRHAEGMPAAGAHTHTVTGGDAETRPANVAVYYIVNVGSPSR